MAEQDPLESESRGVRRVRLAVWASILVLGLSRLYFPLGGDQALFLSYAKGLDQGARLYVDLWDVKQPGVFWYYQLAGGLFGFSSIGTHVFEWFWLCAAALLLWKAGRLSFRSALAPELVPLLTVGLYYWWAGFWYLGQVEILVLLPLAGCLLASVIGLRQPDRLSSMHFAFGLCAAIVAIFKVVLIIVPVTMWLVFCALIHSAKVPNGSWPRALLLAVTGAALPLGAVAWYFQAQGSWEIFYWTNFVYPREILVEIRTKELWHLLRGASWLLLLALPVAIVAIIRIRTLLKEPPKPIELLVVAWLSAGIVAIVLQKFSWWTYHFLLLVAPVGLLTASLIDRHLADPGNAAGARKGRLHLEPMLAAMLVAMFLLSSLHSVRAVAATAAALKAPSGERLIAFRTVLDSRYRERIEESAFLRNPSLPADPIYVFGNPNWLLEARRAQALPIHGWAWESMLEKQWAALPSELRAKAPAFIYVDAAYRPDVAQRAPEAAAFIREAYVPVAQTTEDGTWYRLKKDPPAAVSKEPTRP